MHDIHKTHVMQKFAKLWRNRKSELSRKTRTLTATGKGHLARNIALTKPDNIGMVEWKAFVKNQLSKGFIEKSNKFKDMRAKQTVLHTMSRKGYARLEEEMKNQSPHLDSISRVDVWIKGHTRNKGKPVNEMLQAAVKKVEELHKPSTKEGPMSIKDDAIVHAFGPECRGSVRGLGFYM